MNLESIGKFITIISRQNHIYISNKLKPYGLGNSEYPFLLHMPDSGEINQRQMCDIIIVDPALASRSVKALVEKGMIIKTHDKNDSRACNLSLTEKGKETKRVVRKTLGELSAQYSDNFTPEEYSVLLNQLSQIAEKSIELNQLERENIK